MRILLTVYNHSKNLSEHTTTGFLKNFSKFLIELFGLLIQIANFANRNKNTMSKAFKHISLNQQAQNNQNQQQNQQLILSVCCPASRTVIHQDS